METDILDKKKILDLIHSIGLKYQLSDEVIKNIVNSPYLFANNIIKQLDIREVETEEEFNKLKTNFYFKSLGKLHIPYSRVSRRNKQRESATNVNKRRWKK